MPIALAAFLMEPNSVGSMSLEEITNIAFKYFDLQLLFSLNPSPFMNSLNFI